MNRYTRRLSVLPLEDRCNPASSFIANGSAAGGVPLVDVLRPDGTEVARFQPFDTAFRGGVRATTAELDGNPNTVEVIAAAGPGGGPHVKVYTVDLASGNVAEVAGFYAFEPSFTGGVRVAAGRLVAGTTTDQIVVAADSGGGPHVKTFRLTGNTVTQAGGPLGSFFAFEPGFTGGVRVAAGELDGNTADGDELVVAAGSGGGPRVKVLRTDGATLADYFAFRSDFLGGVNVGTESTGGAVDRVIVDGQQGDLSQRYTPLSQSAFTAAGLNITGTAATAGNNTNFGNATTVGNTTTLGNTGLGTTTGLNTGFAGTNTSSGLSSGFFPSAGSVFGATGNPIGATGSSIGTTGFGTNGLGSTFGVAGLGTPGFATGGFNTTGFGNTVTTFNNTGFGVFGDPGTLNAFPTLASVPFTTSPIFGPTLVTTNGVSTVTGTTGF